MAPMICRASAARVVVTLLSLLSMSVAHGQRAGKAVSPRDAVAAITSALDAYPLVAIGEMHRNQQVHDLIVALVRDARFLPSGGDVVVEFGNARYQDRIDRYIAGGTVDQKSLSQVWRDAVNILVWDAPVYERFFATVRDVNRSRSAAHRIRVVLADRAIDWAVITDRATWEQIAGTRDQHFAEVIEREVLGRGRHALLIFGSAHVEHERAFDPYGKPVLADLLDAAHPHATLYVTADWMNAETDSLLARLRPPVLIPLNGTALGEAHLGPPPLEELADAFLYLGPTSSLTTSVPAPQLYSDTVYLRELLRRDAIQGGANAAELRKWRLRFLDGRQQ
ncbi:MAG: hypothetical protein ACJ79A_13950 [Gemmatimonadaceae bacterium]